MHKELNDAETRRYKRKCQELEKALHDKMLEYDKLFEDARVLRDKFLEASDEIRYERSRFDDAHGKWCDVSNKLAELEQENKRLLDGIRKITESDNPYDVAWELLGVE